MKYIPMLYSTPMVESIIADIKEITRRTRGLELINKAPNDYDAIGGAYVNNKGKLSQDFLSKDGQSMGSCVCPYGQPGDIIWVRESFAKGIEMEDGYFKTDSEGNYLQKFWYKATDSNLQWYDGESDFPAENVPWKPSIHMPREACRLFLKIANIRVERLQDISEEDAVKEGIKSFRPVPGDGPAETQYYHYLKDKWGPSPIHSFQTLWEKINGPDSWAANPWCWCVSFEVIKDIY